MFESKIDPDDLAIIVDQWEEDGRRIPLKGEAEESQVTAAQVNRVENAVRNLVLALSGRRLTP